MDKDNELHTLIYDIIDNATYINQEMYRLADHIDVFGVIPNSLQGMLGKIYRYEGRTQAEIAQIYDIDIKNTIKYVNELYKRGYVRKEQVDNKRKVIYLTKEGHRVNQHFMKERAILLNKVIDEIALRELDETRNVLVRMSKIIKTHNERMKSSLES